MYKVVRNTGWNQNIRHEWLVVDAGGIVVYSSDLASVSMEYAEKNG